MDDYAVETSFPPSNHKNTFKKRERQVLPSFDEYDWIKFLIHIDHWSIIICCWFLVFLSLLNGDFVVTVIICIV